MSRTIQEPTTQRAVRGLGFSADQLYRRPAPETGESATAYSEWVAVNSTTNWVAPSPTDLNFVAFNGSWDTATPTFDLNGDANLEIAKGGVYEMVVEVIGPCVDGSGTVAAECVIGVAIISGELPGSSANGLNALNAYYEPILPYYIPVTTGMRFQYMVHYQNVFSYDEDAFTKGGTAGPSEFQITGLEYFDGVAVNCSTVIVRMYVIRLGPQWVDP